MFPQRALHVLAKDYPDTARLLEFVAQPLLERMPVELRTRWVSCMVEFIETFAREAEAVAVKRTQVDVFDAFTNRP